MEHIFFEARLCSEIAILKGEEAAKKVVKDLKLLIEKKSLN